MVMHAHTRSSDDFVSVENRPMSCVQIVFVRNKTLRVEIGSQLSLSAPYFIPKPKRERNELTASNLGWIVVSDVDTAHEHPRLKMVAPT